MPWDIIQRLALHYEKGASKYDARNWEKGLPLSNFFDSAMRHLIQWSLGNDDEDHLIAVIWNIAGASWTQERIREGILPTCLADIPSMDFVGMLAKARNQERAVEAIDRNRGRSLEELITQVQPHPADNKPVRFTEQYVPTYPQEAIEAVKKVLGTWQEISPYTDLADIYVEEGVKGFNQVLEKAARLTTEAEFVKAEETEAVAFDPAKHGNSVNQ